MYICCIRESKNGNVSTANIEVKLYNVFFYPIVQLLELIDAMRKLKQLQCDSVEFTRSREEKYEREKRKKKYKKENQNERERENAIGRKNNE